MMLGGGTITPALAAAAAAFYAQLVIAPPTPSPIPLGDETFLAFGNVEQRMTVPVSINRRGPWAFVIDTGAERTVVSRELAGVLGLPAGPNVRVTAMTGSATVDTVIVPQLSVSSIDRARIEAPALESRNLGAPGMLGVDALQGHSVAIDFDKNRMTLKPSKKRGLGPRSNGDEVVVVAKSLFGQLIVTDARIGGQKIAVIVDTGTPVSVGNRALLAAMGKRAPKPIGTISVISAIGGELNAPAYLMDRLEIGGIGFRNVPLAIADAPPFKRFQLVGRPALLLGMDTLRLFRRVNIDFANREIRFTLPRGGQAIDPSVSGV